MTRGQTGSDGPATSTPSSAVPVRHMATSAPNPDAGATGGGVPTQEGGCIKATQVDSATRSRLPWLPTDEETETEPEDLYSQGDRVDLRKDRWERAVGGAVSGTRRLVPPRGPLGRNLDCYEEEMNDRSQQSRYGESRPFRLGHPTGHAGASATETRAPYGETDDCCRGICETRGICDRRRAGLCTMWCGARVQQSRPMTATGMSAAAAWHSEGNDYSRSQRHPVPLDAPDVALRGQRLMAYGERLRREEGRIIQESSHQQIASTPDGTTGPRGMSEKAPHATSG